MMVANVNFSWKSFKKHPTIYLLLPISMRYLIRNCKDNLTFFRIKKYQHQFRLWTAFDLLIGIYWSLYHFSYGCSCSRLADGLKYMVTSFPLPPSEELLMKHRSHSQRDLLCYSKHFWNAGHCRRLSDPSDKKYGIWASVCKVYIDI